MTAKQPFEAIVAQHGPTVLRVCRAVLGRADADDAWSETFLAALRAYPDLPGRRQRRSVAGDDRAPQGDRRHPGRRPPRRPGGRRCPSDPAAAAGRRPRPGPARRPGRPAAQAAGSGRLPLPGRPALPRRRRHHRRQRRRRPPGRGRRHRPAAPRPTQQAGELDDERRYHDPRPPRPARCLPASATPTWPRCTPGWLRGADADGLLDLAYRTLDSPVGHAAARRHPAGPGPGRLRQRRPRPGAGRARRPDQPADPERPAAARRRGPRDRRVLHRRRGAASTCRWTSGWPPGSAAPCSATCPPSATATPPATRQVAAAAGSPRAVRAAGTACATQPAAGRRALPPGGPVRRLSPAATVAARPPSNCCSNLEAAA